VARVKRAAGAVVETAASIGERVTEGIADLAHKVM
jgi:hypothetical protein